MQTDDLQLKHAFFEADTPKLRNRIYLCILQGMKECKGDISNDELTAFLNSCKHDVLPEKLNEIGITMDFIDTNVYIVEVKKRLNILKNSLSTIIRNFENIAEKYRMVPTYRYYKGLDCSTCTIGEIIIEHMDSLMAVMDSLESIKSRISLLSIGNEATCLSRIEELYGKDFTPVVDTMLCKEFGIKKASCFTPHWLNIFLSSLMLEIFSTFLQMFSELHKGIRTSYLLESNSSACSDIRTLDQSLLSCISIANRSIELSSIHLFGQLSTPGIQTMIKSSLSSIDNMLNFGKSATFLLMNNKVRKYVMSCYRIDACDAVLELASAKVVSYLNDFGLSIESQ